MLMSDRDDMIVKAMSWALRRLGTVDPGASRDFVNRHREKLAGLIVREVTRKLETGRKDGRRGFTVESAQESRGKLRTARSDSPRR